MDLQVLLSEIGFTEYEAKVYLELLRNYPATGYQLSKEAGIPRSMVYEALGRLANRGAVLETREDRATLYRPLPPDTLLDMQEKEQRRVAGLLRTGLSQRYTFQEEDHLWSMTGQRSVFVYAVQMIRQARSQVLAVFPDSSLELLKEELRTIHEAGVAVHAVLTGQGDLGFGISVRHPQAESQIQQMTGMTMLVVDGKEVLIANSGDEITATITRNRHLLLIATQFVWMEMFTQRIQSLLGEDLLSRLPPDERVHFEGLFLNHPVSQEGKQ